MTKLAEMIRSCTDDELIELERRIRFEWANEKKTKEEYEKMVEFVLQNRNFEANL
jgi:hypothetical protein